MQPYTEKVEIVTFTNTSIKVRLEDVTWPDTCSSISHPVAKYTVYHRLQDDMKPNEDCQEADNVCTVKVCTYPTRAVIYSVLLHIDDIDIMRN